MKQLLTVLSFVLIFQLNASAQFFELGAFFGTSNYQGDLVPEIQVPNEYYPTLGLFGRYNFTSRISLKAQFYKGTIAGGDEYSDTESGRLDRNLSFESNIYEFGLQGEISLFKYNVFDKKRNITPYAFAGIAGFRFNPRGIYKGKWHELQPLGTEGQGLPGYEKKYSLTQISIPMGGGIKFAFNRLASVGIEAGLRKTFTDYLDDVSGTYPDMNLLFEARGEEAVALSYREFDINKALTKNPVGDKRGNPDALDWYFFGGITISVNLNQDKFFDSDIKGSKKKKAKKAAKEIEEEIEKASKKDKKKNKKSKKKAKEKVEEIMDDGIEDESEEF